MTKTFQLCIASDTSRASTLGLRPKVFINDRKTLIKCADTECTQAGTSLEDLAGIEMKFDEDGNGRYERDLTADELWELAQEKLDDDGRLFVAFDDTAEGRIAFLEAADEHGLRAEAETLLADWDA